MGKGGNLMSSGKKRLFVLLILSCVMLLMAGCEFFDFLDEIIEEGTATEFTLTMQIEGQGTVTPDEGTHTYEEDTFKYLTATPAEGCEFLEWIGDVADTESAETTILMDEDH